MFVVAKAIDALIADGVNETGGYSGQQMVSKMAGMSFQGASGSIEFDTNGDRVGQGYVLLNMQDDAIVNVGVWSSLEGLRVNNQIIWRDGTSESPVGAIYLVENDDEDSAPLIYAGLGKPHTQG